MIFWEIVCGVLGGIVGGMGMGGGTLTIPLLTIFLNFKQLRAQGVNLIAFLPMSVVALVIHIKNDLVEFKQTWLLAVVGCVFSVLGAVVANKINSLLLKKFFAVFLILLGIWQFIEMKRNKSNQQNDSKKE